MYYTNILCEMAKLHQRDIETEIILRQIAKQAQAAKPGLMKGFTFISESLSHQMSTYFLTHCMINCLEVSWDILNISGKPNIQCLLINNKCKSTKRT